MVHIKAKQIIEVNNFKELVEELRNGFQSSIETPLRHHHTIENPSGDLDNTLLLMPSWELNDSIGVKVLTVSPQNADYSIPSIHGLYILFDAQFGTPNALLDGRELTVKRTAAASALASSYLSRKESDSLLMIGTGSLSEDLIRAHCSQRPIQKVWIWGRSSEKAEWIKSKLDDLQIEIEVARNLDTVIPQVSIISCATLSPTPLVKGELLVEGQYIDLVGSYQINTREADDDVIIKSSIFVDTYHGALKETGDIVIPMNKGLLKESDILADLFDLTSKKHLGRKKREEITMFKSVGHASEDLIAANYFYKKILDLI